MSAPLLPEIPRHVIGPSPLKAAVTDVAASQPSSNVGIGTVKAQEHLEKPTLTPSPGLGAFLHEVDGSLAFTTYQSSRIFFVSGDEYGQTTGLDRIVGSAMGLAVDERQMWISNKEQVWKFANIGSRSEGNFNADAIYMPRKGHFLGPCDTHDILADTAFGGQVHELLFVNTAFSCVCSIDEHYNFRPVWKPDFITTLSPEDRCHLNGMCARDGELRYVTLCGQSDTKIGWKEFKKNGGQLIDVESGRALCKGLSMPHSPRWHDQRVWLLNSGEGDFGFVEDGKFVPVGLCPGFARGLCFVGGLAVVGVSRLRPNSFAAGLRIKSRLEEQSIREMCGLLVINPSTGKLIHWLTIEGGVSELYDVAFLPGVRRPFTPGFSHPELHRVLIDLPDIDGFPQDLPPEARSHSPRSES